MKTLLGPNNARAGNDPETGAIVLALDLADAGFDYPNVQVRLATQTARKLVAALLCAADPERMVDAAFGASSPDALILDRGAMVRNWRMKDGKLISTASYATGLDRPDYATGVKRGPAVFSDRGKPGGTVVYEGDTAADTAADIEGFVSKKGPYIDPNYSGPVGPGDIADPEAYAKALAEGTLTEIKQTWSDAAKAVQSGMLGSATVFTPNEISEATERILAVVKRIVESSSSGEGLRHLGDLVDAFHGLQDREIR